MGLRNRTLLTEERCFFVTTTCWHHQPLLFDNNCYKILFDSFAFYNQKYHARLVAYVFMTNYIHFIIVFLEKNHLIEYMRDFKKFTSLKLREYIQLTRPHFLDDIAYAYRTQHFKIWTDRFDDVYLYSRDVCETKIDYMHTNPVRAGMVNCAADYRYSSMAFYNGLRPQSQLLHYRELF
ncbi:transposase [Spirosoma sp. RP8]|uniref:Transposase n=1 Tax=Spirosoma liriopis TaxID=2937440 RepID=A0ABT0HMR0_9BACT|nr:transposase [Spirosoma liriopis]MCK8493459.1 transposase [Spirosoma liriopis]